MDPEGKPSQPERENTDESLRTERQSSDQVITEILTDVQAQADEVVELARERADAVLDMAREKADLKLEADDPGRAARATIARERTREDQVLEVERTAEDETLFRQREELERTLAALLPLEREQTDRHLLTERARDDDKIAQRDDFLGMVSHDLRNLLCGVVLEATVLAEEASDSDEGRRTAAGMKRLQRYVARMNRLIGDLVDVVSIDAGRLSVRPRRGDAVALLAEAVAAFAPAAQEKGISLAAAHLAPAGPVLPADFDHDRILQVLANLITNALKFTPRGGRILIRGERGEDELRLSVSDTGIGIPANMMEAVFQRFWQVGKDDPRGLGLGLYISRCIVEAHGGKVWAESRLGEGCTFQLTIPDARSPTALSTN